MTPEEEDDMMKKMMSLKRTKTKPNEVPSFSDMPTKELSISELINKACSFDQSSGTYKKNSPKRVKFADFRAFENAIIGDSMAKRNLQKTSPVFAKQAPSMGKSLGKSK